MQISKLVTAVSPPPLGDLTRSSWGPMQISKLVTVVPPLLLGTYANFKVGHRCLTPPLGDLC